MSANLNFTSLQPAMVLHFGAFIQRMDDLEFFEFCQRNPQWRIERTSEGDLIVMPPTGGITGRRNFALTGMFFNWVERDGSGIGFDSSTGFTLPNNAERSPDVAWVKRERWAELTPEQQAKFPPLCPDFVIELRSRTDSLEALQAKMREYIEQGAQLGWLLDPMAKRAYVYRPQSEVEILDDPREIVGDSVVSGFILDVKRLWQ